VRRGLALLAASGALALAGVAAGTPAPAEATPTVSLSANPAFLLTGQATTLTATATSTRGAPLAWIYVFDTTTDTLICGGLANLGCTGTEEQSVAITHSFVAYVSAFDFGNTFPPLDIQATSAPVTVTWEPLHKIP
jgi:hypothetical protein